MQHLTYVVFISLVHYYAHCWLTHAILLVQSPRPMTVVFGLGNETAYAHVYKSRNGVQCKGTQKGRLGT